MGANDPSRRATMTGRASAGPTLGALDAATRALVRLAAVIAVGREAEVQEALRVAAGSVPTTWVEELILQSYLFAGFPRTLNAARAWRKTSGVAAPSVDEDADHQRVAEWRTRGEATCATVYGPMYERLRVNIRQLHPALDDWMIVEGYGKVLGRPGLDLARRELCIVAVCAAAGQERQLHSHLHGALHAGAAPEAVDETLLLVSDMLDRNENDRVARLWQRVRGQ
jgi:4-carboxymuconolactone decarboxylase